MEVDLIINPIHPAELNISVLKSEEIKIISIPDGIPQIRAARKTGMSAKLNFRKEIPGKIDSRPKKPSINDITINIELYTVVRTLFRLIILYPLSYTKY